MTIDQCVSLFMFLTNHCLCHQPNSWFVYNFQPISCLPYKGFNPSAVLFAKIQPVQSSVSFQSINIFEQTDSINQLPQSQISTPYHIHCFVYFVHHSGSLFTIIQPISSFFYIIHAIMQSTNTVLVYIYSTSEQHCLQFFNQSGGQPLLCMLMLTRRESLQPRHQKLQARFSFCKCFKYKRFNFKNLIVLYSCIMYQNYKIVTLKSENFLKEMKTFNFKN